MKSDVVQTNESDLSGTGSEDQIFDWENCWYPVSFLCDLPLVKPFGFTLYDEPMVLFFADAETPVCLHDRCPHRAARLSDGQIVDGRLECLYHGWQWGARGDCVCIPQWDAHKALPSRSRARAYPTQVKHGIVWVWAGDPQRADPLLIPTTEEVGDKDVYAVSFQMDLPYDQTYLIENVIDVAHIHIAHDGVRGGGKREAAKPLVFEIRERSIECIRANFRSIGLERDTNSTHIREAQVEYVAPNLVRYRSAYQDERLVSGLELYSIPLGRSRCRLLYRKYSNFTGWRERIKPRWIEHLTQCLILEQDMAVVIGQHEEVERVGRNLEDLWLPLKSSDRLVIEYRKWLDRHGARLPFYRGFSSSRNITYTPSISRHSFDRHELHTKVCATCTRVHQATGMAVPWLWTLVAVFTAAALIWPDNRAVFASLALLTLLVQIAMIRFRTQF